MSHYYGYVKFKFIDLSLHMKNDLSVKMVSFVINIVSMAVALYNFKYDNNFTNCS